MADGNPARPPTTRPDWQPPVGTRIWVGGLDRRAKRIVVPQLQGLPRPPTGAIDLGYIMPQSVAEAVYFAAKTAPRLVPPGRLWIVYPKPTSPYASDFDGDREELSAQLAALDLKEHCVAEVGSDYTASCFHVDAT